MEKKECIIFAEGWLNKEDNTDYFPQLRLIYRIFGFNKSYLMKILEDPRQEGDNWIYKVKNIGYQYKWLGIKIYTKYH